MPTAKEESALLSAFVTTGTLVVSAVGVGILSFPHALATSRVPAFALSMVMVDLAAAAGLAVIATRTFDLCARWRPLAKQGDAWSYERLVGAALGDRAAAAAAVAVVLNLTARGVARGSAGCT